MQLTYSAAGFIHLVASIAALAFGLFVFLNEKGTRVHKLVGYGYLASMLALNISAFLVYRLFGGFGPFHIAALISLATLAAGFIPVYLRRPKDRWLQLHLEFMSWSYVGLLAAAFAEIAVRIPATPFWGGVIGSSIGVFVIGGILISRTRARFVKAPQE